MPKEIALTALGNRIMYATTNGKGLITGKSEDITDQAIGAVFMHLKREFESKNPNGKGIGTNFDEEGSLMYLKDGTKIVWKEGAEDEPN